MTIPEEEGEGEFNNDCGFFGGLDVEELVVEDSVLEDAPTLVAGNKYAALEERLAQIRKEKQLIITDDIIPIKDKRKSKKGKNDKKGKKGASDSEDELVIEQVEPVATVDYFDSDAGALGQTAETFADFNLSRQLLKGLALVKFDKPTPIQRAAIPVALMGKDICGGAVTGSGKTAAFLIPIIERLIHRPRNAAAATRVLVLLPTRELAVQCHDVAIKLAKFTNVRCCLAAGGLAMRAQQADLKMRPELVIATPGRLIDHLRNSPSFSLDSVEILILDEADRMLEDGFADELDEIIRHTPTHRQTILFSATMTDNVNELVRLSLRKPARIFVDNNTTISRTLQQEFVRIREEREADRLPLLLTLCRRTCSERCIVFFPTKDLAHRFRLILGLVGLRCAELHGGLTQAERLDALERFKDGAVDFLTATDVAARGLDIRGVKFVVNYSMPANYKLYLHRVGRTARAGSGGCSITLVGEGADRKLLKMVIKNSTMSVKHRLIQPNIIDTHRTLIDEMQSALGGLLEEEREAKLLVRTGKELQRAENLLEHEKEIATRPKKTWFQTVSQKQKAKKRDINSLGHDAKRTNNGKSKRVK